jgi:hypothetical protein
MARLNPVGIGVAVFVGAALATLAPTRAVADATNSVFITNVPKNAVPVVVTSPSPIAIQGVSGSVPIATRSTNESSREPIHLSALNAYIAQRDSSVQANFGGYVVPAHKRLVVETISATISVGTGQIASMTVAVGPRPDVNMAVANQVVFVPCVLQGQLSPPSDAATYVCTQSVRMYGEPGDHVAVYISRGGPPRPTSANAYVYVTGGLIDL